MEKARRQGSKESPVVGLKFCFKLFPTYLSSTPVGFGMHLGKWGLAPTLHIGFFSHPVFVMTGLRVTEVPFVKCRTIELFCFQRTEFYRKSSEFKASEKLSLYLRAIENGQKIA